MTIKQPIWRSDLVDAVMSSLRDPAALGTIYEAAGPQRLTQAELLQARAASNIAAAGCPAGRRKNLARATRAYSSARVLKRVA